MVIAFDGGAFQQTIAAGIFNVAKGFLNASAKLDGSIEFVLVGDPRLGPMRPDLVDQLAARPEVFLGEIGPAYGARQNGLITNDPEVRFVVDRVAFPANCYDGWLHYEGPAPLRSFEIASRYSRPCDVTLNSDRRELGVCFDQIVIEGEGGSSRHLAYDCEALSEGFHSPEAGYRWTAGRGVIPKSLLPHAGTIRVAVHVLDTMPYRIAEGRFDGSFNNSQRQIAACRHRLAVHELGHRLRRRGVTTYFCNHFLPVTFAGINSVAWAYDIIPILFPQFFLADAVTNFNSVVDIFRKTRHIFSISEKTKEDLVMHLGIEASRVTVAGIDGAENLDGPPPTVINAVLEKYNLPHDVILCVGTLEPRKNHLRLVQAYHQLFRADGGAPRLVFVGKPGWGYEGLLDEIRKLRLEDHVALLSEVSEKELSALYADALFVAYPSLYEGFGLPVLEAMAFGKPVLTSRASSMSEVADGAAFLVDPYSVSSIADGLIRLTHDRQLRADLAHRGRLRRDAYSWEKTARCVLDVLRSM
jgi:glycosyltransferase involved in cell wall biosynthesis